MKVQRRGPPSSPSLLLLESASNESPSAGNGPGNYYQFELEEHHIERNKRGVKVFVCDICPSGVFKRSFSLKRHYLRFHINFAFLSPRDINNCAIAIAGQQQRTGATVATHCGAPLGPLIFRCHQCAHLTSSKSDLIKHLETHPEELLVDRDEEPAPDELTSEPAPEAAAAENGPPIDEKNINNRCPRCSTAFSLRETLLKHIKKNRCRGFAVLQVPEPLPQDNIPVLEESGRIASATDRGDREGAAEQMDMELSVRLGCCTSLFRFVCISCTTMFRSFVDLCRHRRTVHGHCTVGICPPDWFLSGPSRPHKPGRPVLPPVTLATDVRNAQGEYAHFPRNVDDNMAGFLDGKRVHIHAVKPACAEGEAAESVTETPLSSGNGRWSWSETKYNVNDLLKLDVPLQQSFFRGLEAWKRVHSKHSRPATRDHPEESSQTAPEKDDSFISALHLRPANAPTDNVIPTCRRPKRPELSGEWTRRKSYICSPCGQVFRDFFVLLDHQFANHASVWFTHIQLDAQRNSSELTAELKRQIRRTGNGPEDPPGLRCTKCHFPTQSSAELHSHILLCSDHATTSPSRKRRAKVIPSSRRKRWGLAKGPLGRSEVRSKSVQRATSSQSKNPSSSVRSLRNRSPKQDPVVTAVNGSARKNARRVLNFSEKLPNKKMKNPVVKRLLRSNATPPDLVNGLQPKAKKVVKSDNTKKKKKLPKKEKNAKAALFECDACEKQFHSQSSVRKHQHYCPNRVVEEPVVSGATPKPKSQTVSKTPSAKTLKSDKIDDTPSPKRTSVGWSDSSAKKTEKRGRKPLTPDIKSPKKKAKRSDSPQLLTKAPVSATPESATPTRPVRSSRKASASLVMEDQMEASFLEALSPDQRVKVGEQRCPFCSKHYVYRSNFKKHLVEGCDSPDAVEEPVPSQSTPAVQADNKSLVGDQKKAPSSSSKSVGKQVKIDSRQAEGNADKPKTAKVVGKPTGSQPTKLGKSTPVSSSSTLPKKPKTPTGSSNKIHFTVNDKEEKKRKAEKTKLDQTHRTLPNRKTEKRGVAKESNSKAKGRPRKSKVNGHAPANMTSAKVSKTCGNGSLGKHKKTNKPRPAQIEPPNTETGKQGPDGQRVETSSPKSVPPKVNGHVETAAKKESRASESSPVSALPSDKSLNKDCDPVASNMTSKTSFVPVEKEPSNASVAVYQLTEKQQPQSADTADVLDESNAPEGRISPAVPDLVKTSTETTSLPRDSTPIAEKFTSAPRCNGYDAESSSQPDDAAVDQAVAEIDKAALLSHHVDVEQDRSIVKRTDGEAASSIPLKPLHAVDEVVVREETVSARMPSPTISLTNGHSPPEKPGTETPSKVQS